MLLVVHSCTGVCVAKYVTLNFDIGITQTEYTVWHQIFEDTIFTDFADELAIVEIALHKTLAEFESFGSSIFIWSNRSGTMSLLHYFSTVSADHKLLDPQGGVARYVPSSAISAANTEVRHMQIEQQSTTKMKRELYTKFTDEQKAEIAKQAA